MGLFDGQRSFDSAATSPAMATLTVLPSTFKPTAPPPPPQPPKKGASLIPAVAPTMPIPAGPGAKQSTIQLQFNPETLKVSYATELAQRKDVETSAQWVKGATAKMSLQCVFDASMAEAAGGKDDVTQITAQLRALVSPTAAGAGAEAPKTSSAKPKSAENAEPVATRIIPRVRFQWGSFQFIGYVESMEENLEYFSPEGRPLRATVNLSLVQNDWKPEDLRNASGPSAIPGIGALPALPVPPRTPFQKLMDGATGGQGWQDQARALGLENPRMLQPGHYINPKRFGGG